MGPRIGRFDKKGNPVPMPGHSVPLSALGGLILIFGFFACNGTKQVRKQLFLLVSKRDLGEYARKERQLIVKEKVWKESISGFYTQILFSVKIPRILYLDTHYTVVVMNVGIL